MLGYSTSTCIPGIFKANCGLFLIYFCILDRLSETQIKKKKLSFLSNFRYRNVLQESISWRYVGLRERGHDLVGLTLLLKSYVSLDTLSDLSVPRVPIDFPTGML